jgi:hypothetical protein
METAWPMEQFFALGAGGNGAHEGVFDERPPHPVFHARWRYD